ncbi:kinesin, putative [Cordyceps militaris]|uniref:Kinesin, putative n=1 Tax=Cordyceps militaris TaxID=73501 RepID=A0A2H4SPJ6_CORMI|nr:kinesin, putative [Cordyceps militaris]
MAERDGKFAIAIICALALELDAVIKLFDGLPEIVPHERRDTIFLSAMFAGHPVLLVKPQQYGKLDAALAMQCMQQRFGEMELTILVGVCGGVAQPYGDGPSAPAPIFLGDVVIGNSIVHYIHAAGISPQGLQMKSAAPQVAGTKLRQLLGYLETEYYMQQVTAQSAAILEQHFRDAEYRCPGESEDLAFSSSYHHLHRRCCPTGCCTSNPPMFCSIAKATPCSDLDCDLEQARRRPTYSQVPRRIHVGTYASDDVVMRDPQVRDSLAKNSNVIAFEMEASGIWQLNTTCLVIKSVSDYGDSHKHKHWQNYAAACAAATTKAVVEHFYPRGARAAIQEINSQRHAPSTVAMLESGNTDLPSDVMQSFVHTKAFQSWLQGQKSMLVATFCHGSSAAETDNQRQLPGNPTAISLARHAAQSRRGCRVFYVDCAGTSEKRPLTRLHKLTKVQQLQPDPSEIDSSLAAANAALGLLFLQIFCSQPRQEQLLLEYMAELPESAVAELQSALLDTGQPPTEAMIPVILYMLGRANWTESFLAIDNMELIGVAGQRRLLADIEVLCTALKTRACVAASSDLKGIIKEVAHLYVSEDTEYKEFLASLQFPDMEARRMHVSAATAETNSWIWSNPEYVAFSRQQSGILWIRGKPGSGKSVLAKFIQETLLERLRSTQGPTGCSFLVGDWFYHRRGGGPHVQHYYLLRSILYHLSKQSRDVFTSFCLAAYRSMDPRNMSWSGDTLKQMILRVCHGPMPVICVVDAVDEAENAEVLSVIRAFAEDTSSSNAKFIILSRPAVAIEQQVAGYHSIVMERENHGDIEKIVCKGLESLRQALHALDLGALPSAECAPRTRGQPRGSRMKQPRSRSVGVAMLHEQLALQEIQNTLIENAQGSVLWVKLVLDQLIRQASSPWTCTLDGLRQAVKRIPHELEEYYTQIVVEMQRQQPAEDIEAIRRMLMWICAAGEIGEVTLEMLSEVMAIIKDNFSSFTVHDIRSSRPLFESWDELWRKMHLTCGVFIEIYNPGLSVEESRDYNYGAASVVQLMHQSVRDFLTESPAAAQLSFNLAEARDFVQSHLSDYLRITGQCLRSRDSGGGSFRCIELLEYLDDWKLLELALLQQHSAAAAFDFRVPPLQEPTPQSPDFYLCAALLSNAHTFEDLSGVVNGASQPGVQNTSNCMELYLPANRLFYRACKDGLVTAVLNMLALGWHRDMAYMDSGPVVMYGVILCYDL